MGETLNYRIRDLTGQRFGKWLVLKFLRTAPSGKKSSVAFWLCRCDCGTEREVRGSDLKQGNTKSCGCSFGREKDLIGRRFGLLVVVEKVKEKTTSRLGSHHWLCKCDCGKNKTATTKYLSNGDTKSCGCLKSTKVSAMNRTHNKSTCSEYRVWCGIIARCEKPSATGYEDYGGRGIKICQRWRNSFIDFLADIGERPSMKHSIDRIDVNGNYEPSNCRWATSKEQANNKRSSLLLTCQGRTQTLTQWANELKVSLSAIRSRIRKGWSPEAALSKPFKRIAI